MGRMFAGLVRGSGPGRGTCVTISQARWNGVTECIVEAASLGSGWNDNIRRWCPVAQMAERTNRSIRRVSTYVTQGAQRAGSAY